MTEFLLLLFVFLFGLSVGSFLNVVILRYHKANSDLSGFAFRLPGQSWFRIFGGRSYCPHCGITLGFFELIPLVSFLIQAGRCRSCSKPISWQYPLVEFAGGAVFALIVWRFFLAAPYDFSFFHFLFFIFLYFIFASLLVIAFVYDARYGLIPDFVSYGIFGLAVVRFLSVFLYSKFNTLNSIFNDLLLAFVVFVLFGGLWFFSRGRAMGFGDVKLAPVIALFLDWPIGVFAILFSFWLGALCGILIIFRRKGFTLKSEIPFGPFLVCGAFIALLYGNAIWSWYQDLLL